MQNRPLYHHLMQEQEYFTQYHTYFEQLIRDYFNSGRFRDRLYQTAQMIAPYVEKDPTAFCGYEDFKAAVDMLFQVCINRAKSVDLQLRGKLPSTLAEQENFGAAYPDVSHIDLNVLGDFDDLETAPKVEELFS